MSNLQRKHPVEIDLTAANSNREQTPTLQVAKNDHGVLSRGTMSADPSAQTREPHRDNDRINSAPR